MTTMHHITTAEQLLAESSRLGRCELVRGELRMMTPAGGEHGDVTAQMTCLLTDWVRRHGLGKVYAAETGFLLERDPDTVRAPDVAFIRRERLAEAETDGFIPIAPDLVVETLSPNDKASAVTEKVDWWLSHGVQAVWIVDPKTQTVTVHAADGSAHRLRKTDLLRGDPVLPGFQLELAELFS